MGLQYTYSTPIVCVCVCLCQSRAPDLIDVGGARRVTRQKCVFFPLGPKNINDGVYRITYDNIQTFY